MFSRVLIANRGAVARRVIRACHDLGVEVGCVHSDIDATTPAVAEADFAGRLPGYKVVDTYLNIDKILDVAREHKVDAIHPGYGFLAESEEFARAAGDAGHEFHRSLDFVDGSDERKDTGSCNHGVEGHACPSW